MELAFDNVGNLGALEIPIFGWLVARIIGVLFAQMAVGSQSDCRSAILTKARVA